MNKWIIAIMASLAAGMEVLDVSAVNISLAHMQGRLSADVDEIAWVLTAYLVSTAIILPLTGWLADFFGRKRFFVFCTILFGTCTALAGLAPSLPVLIIFRVLQGLGGGALIATGHAIVMEIFPPAQRGIAIALWGIGAMASSMTAPVIGGLIIDNFSWRWVFYLNVPIAVIVALLAIFFLYDPPYLKRRAKKIDTLGFLCLIIWVGCLQIILGRGQRLDWFNSTWIIGLAIITVLSFAAFVIRELSAKDPVVDLRIFKNATFTIGTIMMAIQMLAFYGPVVLLSLFAQKVLEYPAFLAGVVIACGAVPAVITMPLGGRLLTVVDPRILIGIGALTAGVGMVLASQLNGEATFWQIAVPRILLGAGLSWIWVSTNTISLAAVELEKMGQASGIFNLLRTLGGGFGIALLTTLLVRKTQTYQNQLVANLTQWDLDLRLRLEGLTSAFQTLGSDPYSAGKQALGVVYSQIQRQASVLSFLDDFRLVAIILFALIPFLLLMKGTKVGQESKV